MDIIFDALLTAREKQIRFPRSRKKRIRKKWSARDANWQFKPFMLQVTDKRGCVSIVAHPFFRQQFEKAVFPLVLAP